jgi:uncharacterized protein YkwD
LRASILDEARVAARKLKRKAPEPDRRLDWAMNDLAHHVRGDDMPTLEAVQFLTAHYGLVEPPPYTLVLHVAAAGADEIPARTRDTLAEMLRSGTWGRIGVGIDRSPSGVHVAIGLQETPLELTAPIPRRLAAGGRAAISARVSDVYRTPAIVITGPDGSVRSEQAAVLRGVVRGDLRCVKDGAYQIEISGVAPRGSSVLANFPVFCGVAPPATSSQPAGMSPGAVNAEAAEREMLELVNRDRTRAGLAAVVADAKLAEIARAHSRDMAENEFVQHVSPRTGALVDRIQRAGLAPTMMAENVGRAYTAQQAQNGFMSSPGHRGNVLIPDARKVGIGIVLGKPILGITPLFVTQVFTN